MSTVKLVELIAQGEPRSGRSVLIWHISHHLRSLGLKTHVDEHVLRVEASPQQLAHIQALLPRRVRLAVVPTEPSVQRPCDSGEPEDAPLTDGVGG